MMITLFFYKKKKQWNDDIRILKYRTGVRSLIKSFGISRELKLVGVSFIRRTSYVCDLRI